MAGRQHRVLIGLYSLLFGFFSVSGNASDVTHAPGHGAASAAHGKAASVPASAHGSGHATPAGVPAKQALELLQNGNGRYLKQKLRSDGRSGADRKRLASGQQPHAIVLSCSDSRVPPELVFDQALGEIFVIRVAGEALDSSVIASVEYAVEHLGSKLIVVMGHTQCGAVKAAVAAKAGVSSGSPDLDKLIASIQPHLKTTMRSPASENFEVEGALNADGVARDLVRRSAIIREKVEKSGLIVKPAVYNLESGKVEFY
jgi:carbonic anhydrase